MTWFPTSMQTSIPALIGKEGLLLLRDRQGLLLLFVMPALFITIMSLAMQGTEELGGSQRSETVWVLDRDATPASQALLDALEARLHAFRFETVAEGTTPEALEARLTDQKATLALVVPAGFEEALGASSEGAATLALDLYYAPHLPTQLRELLRLSLEGGIEQARLAATLERIAPAWGGPGRAATLLQTLPLAVELHPAYGSDGPRPVPNAVQQSVPAWLVFAMFFVVAPLAASFTVERDQGTLTRLRQLNLSAASILLSRIPVYYAVHLVQLVSMLAVGVFLVPALGGERLTLGSSPVGLWLIASSTSVAATGFALLLATLSRTTLQATLMGGVWILIMAAVGGIMVPKAVMPVSMQQFSQISPMSWGLEGFWDILLRQEQWSAAVPEALALLTFGTACWLAAAAIHYRSSS